jgi:ATP-binding cassette subfamily F protein uup
MLKGLMTPICTLKNLTLTYPHKNIFKHVQLTLNKGDRVGLLGLNGHGKSSLFGVLTQSVSPDTTVPPFQFDKSRDFSIFLVPQELKYNDSISCDEYFYEFHPEIKELRQKLNSVEEQITKNHNDSLLEQQNELYEKLGVLEEDRIHQKYLSYLKYFGIDNPQIKLKGLSGGEQRKVALSLGLSAPHEIILWDEPTNHLDLETIELFEDELMYSDKTMMLISHDRTLLNNITDRILHIQHGKLVDFSGSYEEYLKHLQERELAREQEITKLSNTQRRETAWMRRGISARRTRSKKRVENYHSLSKEIQRLKSLAHRKATLSLQSSQRKTKRLLMAESLSKSFDKPLFKNMDFEICREDKIIVMGKNGVGKTTLINILCGNETPDSGKIERAHQLDIGFFSQKREDLNPEISPWDLMGDGTDYVISNTGDRKHVASYLENFLFQSEEIKRPISTFSGGEKNRLQLARFMKDAKDIWIFDEPTNDLDLETIGILEDEIKNYKGAVIIICHDRNFIENIATSCWVIHDQQLEVFENLEQADAFLKAQLLEEKLKTIEPEPKQEVQPVVPEPEKKTQIKEATSKQKYRFSELEELIEASENQIKEIENLLSRFSYGNLDSEQRELMDQLQSKLATEQSKLDSYYQEWEELAELINN